jgi:transposase-like protein
MKQGWTVASNNGEGVSERRDDLLTESKESRSGETPSPGAAQVPGQAKRRSFSASEIAKILADLDKLGRGGRGAYLRQHGLYSGQVSTWRKKQLAGLSANRGPKAKDPNPLEKVVAAKDRRIRELENKLKRAELMLEIQKKAQEALATFQERPDGSGENG